MTGTAAVIETVIGRPVDGAPAGSDRRGAAPVAEDDIPAEVRAWWQRRLAFETFMRGARQAAGVPSPRWAPGAGRLRLITR
jgi:hypothetical protein